jgi:hypothetical protein
MVVLCVWVALGLALPALPQEGWAYGNHAARGDWRVGGPHRTINAIALEKYVEKAQSDPLLSKYDFNNESLKVMGPTVGEPHLFTPGKEDKTATFAWWVTEGGYTADEPELYASFRHFYDPRHAEIGQPPYLTDHLDEAGAYFRALAAFLAATGNPISGAILDEIGRNPQVDARDWAINGLAQAGWGENEYSWTKGLETMRQGFESKDAGVKSRYFAQAWRALGETMHLLGDMTTPAHVRNDSHPAYAIDWSILPPELRNPNPNEGLLKGDAYEIWVDEKVIDKVGRARVEPEMQSYIDSSKDPLDLFDRVALFTNASTFSAETISGVDASGAEVHNANGMPDYPSPRLDPSQYDPKTGVYTKRIGGRDVCLAHASWLSEIGWGGAHPRITYGCVLSQAELLVPVAVAGNAKLLEWFVPRVKVEITEVDVQNRILRGAFTHEPSGVYQTALKFNSAEGEFNRFYLNGAIQDWDDYRLEIEDGVLTVTYGDKVAGNIDNARQSGAAVVSVMIDMGGIGVHSNEFPLTPATPSPTPSATPSPTGTAQVAGDWVLQAIIPGQQIQENGPCYFDHQVTVGDGSFASSGSWTDQGCVEGGTASGSAATTCTWSAPPSYLKAGAEVSMTASCQSTAQQTGGGRHTGGWMMMWFTHNPPVDCPDCYMTWSTKFLGDVKASGWSADFPVSGSGAGTIAVPDGQSGDVLAIVASNHGPGGAGWVVYKYAFGAAGPPPERTPQPEPAAPETPAPSVQPPTETPGPTETPPPTATGTPSSPTGIDTLAPLGDQPQPAYGPLAFSSDYDDETMQPLNPGHEFAYGIKILYADWAYSGVRAGTSYEYEWYLDGQLLESSGNSLVNEAGHTFDFYVRDLGAQQPLEPGTYTYVARMNGQVILSAECVVH